jgi:hypothetical protein
MWGRARGFACSRFDEGTQSHHVIPTTRELLPTVMQGVETRAAFRFRFDGSLRALEVCGSRDGLGQKECLEDSSPDATNRHSWLRRGHWEAAHAQKMLSWMASAVAWRTSKQKMAAGESGGPGGAAEH